MSFEKERSITLLCGAIILGIVAAAMTTRCCRLATEVKVLAMEVEHLRGLV